MSNNTHCIPKNTLTVENDYITVVIYHTIVQHAYAKVVHHSMSHSNQFIEYIQKKTIAHRLTPYFQTENNHVCITIHIKRDSIVSLRPYSDYYPGALTRF